jgi:hypothetical protein
MNNKIILGLIILVGLVEVIAGVYLFTKPDTYIVGNSPVGTEFGTAKLASINWSLASASATTTSLYNNDRNDRVITDSFLACDTVGTSQTAYTGAGLAALTLKAATTTTAAPAIVSNTNLALNVSAVATSSVNVYVASSTEPAATMNRIWPAGSYLSFFTNATNTAQCITGVHYLAK